MGRIAGIDLGTTNSAIAVIDEKLGPMVIRNTENEQTTPSVVGVDEDGLLIGSPAINNWPTWEGANNTIFSIKRLMGGGLDDEQIQVMRDRYSSYDIVVPEKGTSESLRVVMGGREYSPIEISAIILSKLKEDAESILQEPITHAIITVPAYFHEKQRYATYEAGRLAGLTVMRLVDEPAAVAVAHGIQTRQEDVTYTLVYDLGGGTFDVSLLRMKAGVYSVMNKEGDMWLGGDDFDRLIIDHVATIVKSEHGIDFLHSDDIESKILLARITLAARQAKESLSNKSSYTVTLAGGVRDRRGIPIDIRVKVTRAWFEEQAMPLVERTIDLTMKTLRDKNLTPDEVDMVLLAGNASSMPMIQSELERLFGPEKIQRHVHPKHSVAIGAAMLALTSMVECPKCKHQNEMATKQCASCHTPLSSVKVRCPSCGEQHPEGTKICRKCGLPALGNDPAKNTDIAPFHYGIQTIGDEFTIFVRKGERYETPISRRIEKVFYTTEDGARHAVVPVYGGENESRASENVKQGEAMVYLPPNLPQATPVYIMVWLNRNGWFDLKARLENGEELVTMILRGEQNQRIVKDTDVLEGEIQSTNALILPPEQQEYEAIRSRIYDALSKNELENAEGNLQDLVEFRDKVLERRNPPRPQKSLEEVVEILIGNAKHVATEYAWAIGDDAQLLLTLARDLEYALAHGNTRAIENGMRYLSYQIDKTLGYGEDQNMTMAGYLIWLFMEIHKKIRPGDPDRADGLEDRLLAIVDRIKRGDRSAKDALLRLSEEVTTRAQDMERKCSNKDGNIPCDTCDARNPPGTRVCPKCGEVQGLLATRKGLGYYTR